MVHYIEYGNIFNLKDVSNYAHGCNCAGAMGKGIALQFKNKFPKMYIEYKQLCKEGKFILGDILVYKHDREIIFNLGTQKNWKTKADIGAIQSSLIKMLSYASEKKIYKIALPKIGAGLGGLKWSDVKTTINNACKEYPNIELFVIENYME